MMSVKRYIISLIFVFLSIILLNADDENIGTTGFNFLRVYYSTRAAGMANAFTGQADDVEAVFYNPAGLPQLTSKVISTSYINYFEGFQGGSIVFAYPGKDRFSFGVFAATKAMLAGLNPENNPFNKRRKKRW